MPTSRSPQHRIDAIVHHGRDGWMCARCAPDPTAGLCYDRDSLEPITPNRKYFEDANTTLTSPAANIELVPGTQLGDYVIEAKVAQGGMGVVYAAVHPVIGKRAAIKVIKHELCDDDFH